MDEQPTIDLPFCFFLILLAIKPPNTGEQPPTIVPNLILNYTSHNSGKTLRTTKKKSDTSPHLKASWVELPFNMGNCLSLARQIRLQSSTTLVLDKALVLNKALDLWIVNPIQQASSSVPTVRY